MIGNSEARVAPALNRATLIKDVQIAVEVPSGTRAMLWQLLSLRA